MITQYNEKPFKVSKNIYQGSDYSISIMAKKGDGTGNINVFDVNYYDNIKCHLKYRLGSGGLIDVTPKILIENKLINITIDEKQTNALRSGSLFFNVLATKDNITTQIFLGVIKVEKGVTSGI